MQRLNRSGKLHVVILVYGCRTRCDTLNVVRLRHWIGGAPLGTCICFAIRPVLRIWVGILPKYVSANCEFSVNSRTVYNSTQERTLAIPA